MSQDTEDEILKGGLRCCSYVDGKGASDLTVDVTSEAERLYSLVAYHVIATSKTPSHPSIRFVNYVGRQVGSSPAEEETGWRRIVAWPRSKLTSGRAGTKIWVWGLSEPLIPPLGLTVAPI